MPRAELILPAIVVVILASSAVLSNHRAGIKDEFMSECAKGASAEECQARWWKSPIRADWTTDDLWACWAGNPDTCKELEEKDRQTNEKLKAEQQSR